MSVHDRAQVGMVDVKSDSHFLRKINKQITYLFCGFRSSIQVQRGMGGLSGNGQVITLHANKPTFKMDIHSVILYSNWHPFGKRFHIYDVSWDIKAHLFTG